VIGDQLDLWGKELAALPWGGQSPRSLVQARHAQLLTSVEKSLFLRREPQKDDRFFVAPDQLELWVPAQKRPVYDGAPLLAPLPGGAR